MCIKKIIFIIFFLSFPIFANSNRFVPSTGGINEISIGFFLADISEIKDMAESITVDFAMRLVWTDPTYKGHFKETQFLNPSLVNIPMFVILNEKNLRRTLGEKVQVDPSGQMNILYRFSGQLSFHGNYLNFPFDRQKFKIIIVFPNEAYNLLVDQTRFSITENISASGWSFEKEKFSEEFYSGGGRSNFNFPSVVMEIEGNRHITYYIWKIFFPMSLIVLMTWAVFWIHPDQLGARISVAITSNLTLIAYLFVLAAMVPQISYFSRIDGFIIGALVLAFLSFFAVIFTYRIHEKDRQRGERFQKIFRWIHLTLFIIILLYQVAGR